jgi:hypothetical protein
MCPSANEANPASEEWTEIQGCDASRFIRLLAVAAAAELLVSFGIVQFSSDDASTPEDADTLTIYPSQDKTREADSMHAAPAL